MLNREISDMSNQEMREFCGCDYEWVVYLLPDSRDDAHVMVDGQSKCALCIMNKWYDPHYENEQWDKIRLGLDAISSIILSEIEIELNCLSESNISKLEDSYSISLKVVKIKGSATITEDLKNEILKELQKCKTREEGHAILAKLLNTKKDLEAFARFLDVSVLRQNKAQIKEKIIESTVGAVIRSNAIRGK